VQRPFQNLIMLPMCLVHDQILMFKSLEYFSAILLLILLVVVLLLIFLPDFPQNKVNQRQEKAETSRTACQIEDSVQHIRLVEEVLCTDQGGGGGSHGGGGGSRCWRSRYSRTPYPNLDALTRVSTNACYMRRV
jgi:hypothetical protein